MNRGPLLPFFFMDRNHKIKCKRGNKKMIIRGTEMAIKFRFRCLDIFLRHLGGLNDTINGHMATIVLGLTFLFLEVMYSVLKSQRRRSRGCHRSCRRCGGKIGFHFKMRPRISTWVCPSVRQSVHPSVRPSVQLSVYPSVCLSVSPPVCQSACPS